jgi:hypothetical protein
MRPHGSNTDPPMPAADQHWHQQGVGQPIPGEGLRHELGPVSCATYTQQAATSWELCRGTRAPAAPPAPPHPLPPHLRPSLAPSQPHPKSAPGPSRLTSRQAAADRWASILKVDVTDAPAGVDYSGGEIKGFSYTDAVDDLVIFYALTYIDGVSEPPPPPGARGAPRPPLCRARPPPCRPHQWMPA